MNIKIHLKEQYQREGFLAIPSFFNLDEVKKYRKAIDVLLHEKDSEIKENGYKNVFSQIKMVWKEESILKEISLNKNLAKIASFLSDMPKVRLFLDQVLCKRPGADETRFHQDAPYLSFDDSRSINCWIALDDTSELNGAMQYYAESHLFGSARIVHLDQRDDLIKELSFLKDQKPMQINCKAGDIVFHNCHLIHGAYKNSSNNPRRAFSIQYMPDGAKYNGWCHPFMEKYKLKVGDPLNLDCFPLLYNS